MDTPSTMDLVKLGILVLGCGATYGKTASALKAFTKWQGKHETENANAYNRIDAKILKIDNRLDSRLLRDDGSSRYVKIEDCNRHRAEQEKHQEMYYETIKTIIVEYHEKSHEERLKMSSSISDMSEKIAVIITRLDMSTGT